MTWQSTPLAALHFAPLETGYLRPKIWAAATALWLVLFGAGALFLNAKNTPVAAERSVSYAGSGLLDPHQLVSLVTATILQHSADTIMSKQIAEVLIQEDRSGDFDGVKTSKELANLLTKRIQKVSHDSRYQVLYSGTPLHIAKVHGKAIYRISEHLSVALPSSAAPQ